MLCKRYGGGQVIRGQRRIGWTTAVAVAAVTAATLVVAGCGSDSADLPDGTAARVGDTPISQTALDRQMEQSLAAMESQGQAAPAKDSEIYTQVEQQALQTLVQQRIIVAEAARCGAPCKVTKADVANELKNIVRDEFKGSQKEFTDFLKQRKLTKDEALEIVRNSQLQKKLFEHVTRSVRFTAEDAQKYYDENKDQFSTPAGREARHILVATEAEAQAIRKTLTPDNFAQIAREKSTDTGSGAQGGDLGLIQKGQMVPEFERAAFALKDGQISQPVKTQFGWHLIMVKDVSATTTPFAQAKAGIMQSQLEQARQQAYNDWAEKVIGDWEKRTVYANPDLKPPAQTAPDVTTDSDQTTTEP